MSPTPDSTLAGSAQIIADLQRSNAELQRQLDERTAELAARNSEYGERIEYQSATVDVLKVMSASPGDPHPVFELIVTRAKEVCNGWGVSLFEYDGALVYHRAITPDEAPEDAIAAYKALFPMVPTRGSLAILDRKIIHVRDINSEAVLPVVKGLGYKSQLTIPMLYDGAAIGAITLTGMKTGGFSDAQVELLKTFAEQAVIAISSAETYRELQQRTDDLQQSLEYQTATSEVLKVISRSTFDLQPVLSTLVETAARLCDADLGHLFRRDANSYHRLAAFGLSPEYRQWLESVVSEGRALVPNRGSIVGRVALEGRVVHVTDLASDPEYSQPESVALGGLRTVVGVPLLREGEPIGVITLGRQRVEPFTERQIELVRTFADQAVIAMENARLLGELRQRTDEVGELNRGLEARVAEQVGELGRVGRLKRFLAPQLAELIVSQGDEKILESHRREIVVVFCDLRGYTAFTETAEPEEVLEFLRQYHGALGPLVSQFEGTLDQFSGDGIMVFFNDTIPCPDPTERAVKMAMAMREAARELIAAWRRHGCELGFGIGIAQGFATLGQIGFSERSGYTAIGTVCNLAARLCAELKDGQILVSSRIAEAVEAVARLEDLGNLELKGLRRPVSAFNVVQSTSLAEARPNLTVVARGPGA